MAAPPSVPGVDAPELAKLGPFAVGVRTVHLGTLAVDVWYPARPAAGAVPERYVGSLPSEPPAAPAQFSVRGIAVRNAASVAGDFPLVVVSHGWSNITAALTWLTENLASKGYVVAAIRHDDPPITEPARVGEMYLRRPLDIAFATAALRKSLAAGHLVDASRVALIGYSIGGYGVLTAAGAALDPGGRAVQGVPAGLLAPYARGGALRGTFPVEGLRAVVAISPAGGGTPPSFGADGLGDVHVPLLLIAGDEDRRVNYAEGARSFFAAATGAPRYLLTFKNAGHDIGLNPPPPEMRGNLWDLSWFADPVWRTDRVNAINLHFITAFLDRFVKGDESRTAYLDVRVEESSAGVWPAEMGAAFDAYSPGTGRITVWKGFQRNFDAGLELLRAVPAPP